jgi:molecular chaperone GrpE (heat shock protein)
VKELLDVADNLRRAVDAVPAEEDQKSVDADKALSLLNSLKNGVVLTERQLLQVCVLSDA